MTRAAAAAASALCVPPRAADDSVHHSHTVGKAGMAHPISIRMIFLPSSSAWLAAATTSITLKERIPDRRDGATAAMPLAPRMCSRAVAGERILCSAPPRDTRSAAMCAAMSSAQDLQLGNQQFSAGGSLEVRYSHVSGPSLPHLPAALC
eukprot:SAG22_NODE_6670_length_825_cov_0.809917_2_plen_150_part_00